MRVLWISSLAWKNDDYPFPVNGPGAVSGSLFQQAMIEGLESLGVEVDLITDYPYANRQVRAATTYSHRELADDVIISSGALPYLNHIGKARKIAAAVRQKSRRKKYDFAIAYLIHTPYLQGLRYAKKWAPSIRTILICPDLPDMMDLSLREKPIKRFLKRLDGAVLRNLYSSVDAYVLFTGRMQEKLPVGEKPYLVLEGVANVEHLNIEPLEKQKAILHAGTLHKNIGIEEILLAMRLIPDSDLELWIFGDGDLKETIREAEKNDRRIRFFGFVDRDQLFGYEKRAALLINARHPEDSYTRYSFPSKTFEYLYSGTPYLTTQLAGTPEEYNEYCYLLSDHTPESIAAGIQQVLREPEADRDEKAKKARVFVQTEKNKFVQAKRFKDFLESLMG